ncbi:MAG: peptidoglycan/LPS O-acetylase OafA/YrhL [Flavobacteriaceae bacterium]|jgi:peptidoglycan/LPS O-acetylase OafA/YrhL
MGLHKIIKIVGLILSLIGVALLGMMIMKGDDVIKETGSGIDAFIYTAYAIFALVLIAVVIFGLKGLMSGNIKNTLIILGAFIVVIGVSYGLADNNPLGIHQLTLSNGEILTDSNSKWIGAGLYTFYILAIIAIGSMIVSGFKKAK